MQVLARAHLELRRRLTVPAGPRGRPGAVVESGQRRSRGGVRRLAVQLPLLTYLHLARLAGFQIDRYVDEAVGHGRTSAGGLWGGLPEVVLNPQITYGGDKRPTPAEKRPSSTTSPPRRLSSFPSRR